MRPIDRAALPHRSRRYWLFRHVFEGMDIYRVSNSTKSRRRIAAGKTASACGDGAREQKSPRNITA
jgi:hypothetical protein